MGLLKYNKVYFILKYTLLYFNKLILLKYTLLYFIILKYNKVYFILKYTLLYFNKLILLKYALLYFNNHILSRSTIYVILARHISLPEDGVLTSKHVGANHM